MNVLLIGSGGREHAIAWKVAQSPLLTKLYIAPGNPGTAALGENVTVRVDDHAAIVRCCQDKHIDLVIVGPEIPLAAGVADDLQQAGIKVFGPSKAAARIEASKSFSKDFMQRHGIPTARYATFTKLPEALAYLSKTDYPVVLKASGLAAGKGVILPETSVEAQSALEAILVGGAFGDAGNEVVIEERLSGPEITLLAFTTVKPMVPSQDHKRALDGDLGPNTGGMGAYAPVPVCPAEMITELVRIALQPAVDGLREEGCPFMGVLYGGFMLTEAQVVLPMLGSDLLEIALACAEGRLNQVDVSWKDGAAACVVLASGGYPGKYQTGYPISGLEAESPNAFVFHAGTKMADGKVVTAGGRVLCATGWGTDIQAALVAAYDRIRSIHFEAMHFRADIGWRVSGENI